MNYEDWKDIQKRKNIISGTLHYDLSHLSTYEKIINIHPNKNFKALSLTIEVVFKSHCISRSIAHEDIQINDEIIYDERKIPRVFCPIRYRLSLRLKEIISDLDEKKCYFTQYDNWFHIEDIDNQFYRVYFSIKRIDNKNLIMFIESAYLTDKKDNIRRSNKIGFKMIVSKKAQGKEIRQPNN